MRTKISSLVLALVSVQAWAQEHGHSHGAGGENEHLYPILGVFAGLAVIGGLFFLFGKKK